MIWAAVAGVILLGLGVLIASRFTAPATAQVPVVQFQERADTHELVVASAEAGADWRDVRAAISGDASCGVSGPTVGSSAGRAPAPLATAREKPIQSGDALAVAGAPGTTCVVDLSFAPNGAPLGDSPWSFRF
ncbi:MAG: hypothetical protein ACYDBQ_10465 [Thermoplasmatota archaeon]